MQLQVIKFLDALYTVRVTFTGSLPLVGSCPDILNYADILYFKS